MAKMIPDYIDPNDPRRNGERLVFDWLSSSAIPGTTYYSLLQKNHKHKLIGEVDFLYVCERGFLCIEVKGGQKIYCEDKKWHSVNRKGQDNIIHNPFIQAKDCMYALKNYLSETYGKYSEQANYLIGYAVIFPECRFTGFGNDLVTEVMYDARFDLSDFPMFLQNTFDYWARLESDKHGNYVKKLTENQLAQVNDLLRGDFHVVPSMHLEFQHVEQKMLELTEEQYDVLDITDDNPRVIVQGAAGTGKTLLAIELVRKMAAKQKNVLYLCFNRNMAEYVKASLIRSEYVTISTYHSLLKKLLGADFVLEKNIAALSKDFIDKISNDIQMYDEVILDEGQDVFCVEVIEVMNALIKYGMDNGSWVMFMDPNQNIFNSNKDFDTTYEIVREMYHPVVLSLRTNCRNTEQIARRTAALTITPPAKYLKLTGPRVITRKYSDKQDFLKLFKKELMSLFSSGVTSDDIVVLSRYKLENSMLSNQSKICNLEVIENDNISFVKSGYLNYFTVQSFKGLESKIVFYIDIDGFSSSEDRKINYVGMSRARIQLYLFYPEEKSDDYEYILDKGENLLV